MGTGVNVREGCLSETRGGQCMEGAVRSAEGS